MRERAVRGGVDTVVVTKIRDIQPGQYNLNVVGKIVSINRPHEFQRQGSSSKGQVASVVLQDETGEISFTLWNQDVHLLEEWGVKTGDLLRVTNGRARDARGHPELNIVSPIMTQVEVNPPAVPDISLPTTPLQAIKLSQSSVQCSGTITRKSGPWEFVRDGETRQRASITLRDATGERTIWFWTETIQKFQTVDIWDEISITALQPKPGWRNKDIIDLHLRPDSTLTVTRCATPIAEPATAPVTPISNTTSTSDSMLKNIDQLHEGDVASIRGHLTQPFTHVHLYEACPTCWRKIGSCSCPQSTTPILRVVINGSFKDATGTIRTTFFGDLAQQLVDCPIDFLKDLFGTPGFDERMAARASEIVPKEVILRGRVKSNQFAAWQGLSTALEFAVQSFQIISTPGLTSPPVPVPKLDIAQSRPVRQAPYPLTPQDASGPTETPSLTPLQSAPPVALTTPVGLPDDNPATVPSSSPATQVMAETEEVEEVEKAQTPAAYQACKIHVTDKGILTRPIPYWAGKLLVAQNRLTFAGNAYQVSLDEDLPFDYIVEDAAPIRGRTPNQLDLVREDSLVGILEGMYSSIRSQIDNCTVIFQQCRQINPVKENFPDFDAAITFLYDVEERERDVQAQGYLWSRPGFLCERNLIDSELIRLHASHSATPDMTYWKQASCFIDTAALVSEVQDLLDEWCEVTEVLDNLFAPLLQQVSSVPSVPETPIMGPVVPQAPAPGQNTPVDVPILFGGQPFQLFAFDVNNLHKSAEQKFDQTFTPVPQKIAQSILPRRGPYVACYFASQHLAGLKRFAPEDAQHQWFIEKYIKRWEEDGRRVDCDVDSLLSGKISAFLAQYHTQIERFTLGSGDKDLHYVCDLAQQYDIPVDVVVVDQTQNLSRELRSLAENVTDLY